MAEPQLNGPTGSCEAAASWYQSSGSAGQQKKPTSRHQGWHEHAPPSRA
eukprot:COSAG05_NODE_4764_length_1381_cov_1.297192_3_plen_48_part_01